MSTNRRRFLQRAAVVGGMAAAGPFSGILNAAGASSSDGTAKRRDGYGPLRRIADNYDGKYRLELPRGFHYRSFHHAGGLLSDGTEIPGRGDGMAVFPGPRHNQYRIVRNHEINGPTGAYGDTSTAYDPLAGGGTVSAVVTRHGRVRTDWVSLNGTQNNCAGGKTPWGSWLSCEETINGDDVGDDFTGQSNAGLQKHGYVFEVPAHGKSNGVPIRDAGRFAHEAAAVDPGSGMVYLTEDNFAFASGFYRYAPPLNPMSTGSLSDGGALSMLKVVGVDEADLSLEQAEGATYDVEWVPIADPDPTFAPGVTNDEAIVGVGDQGRALGAAWFSRLEGCVYDAGLVYFVSTQGGPTVEPDTDPSGFGAGRGQIWAYSPAASTLRLVFQSPGSSQLDLPDNIEASSSGALVLCEDGKGDNFLRGLTLDGDVFDFVRNTDKDQEGQEFAGAAFSPDFETLFVNIQSSSGYSMAIWGPWNAGPFV